MGGIPIHEVLYREQEIWKISDPCVVASSEKSYPQRLLIDNFISDGVGSPQIDQ